MFPVSVCWPDTRLFEPRPQLDGLIDRTEMRAALTTAHASGVKQKDLAREYGISIRSVNASSNRPVPPRPPEPDRPKKNSERETH